MTFKPGDKVYCIRISPKLGFIHRVCTVKNIISDVIIAIKGAGVKGDYCLANRFIHVNYAGITKLERVLYGC